MNEFLGFNPNIPQYLLRKKHHVLVDAELNIYSSMMLEPIAVSDMNRLLDEENSPYQWQEASEA